MIYKPPRSQIGAFLQSGLTPLGLEDEALVSAAHTGKERKGARMNNSDLKIMLRYVGVPAPVC